MAIEFKSYVIETRMKGNPVTDWILHSDKPFNGIVAKAKIKALQETFHLYEFRAIQFEPFDDYDDAILYPPPLSITYSELTINDPIENGIF